MSERKCPTLFTIYADRDAKQKEVRTALGPLCEAISCTEQDTVVSNFEITIFKACSHGAITIVILLFTTNGLHGIQSKCQHGVIATKLPILHKSYVIIRKSQSQSYNVKRPLLHTNFHQIRF